MADYWVGKIFRRGNRFGVVFEGQQNIMVRKRLPGEYWNSVNEAKAGSRQHIGEDDAVHWVLPREDEK